VTTATALDITSRLESLELYSLYTHAYDRRPADEVAALFTEDGEFVRAGADPVRGHRAIAPSPRWCVRPPAPGCDVSMW
jgi:hypothetical protein